MDNTTSAIKPQVLVCYHLPLTTAPMPPTADGKVYRPIHVGRAGKTPLEGMIGDNTGEDISHLNSSYAELTAIYWAWKNPDLMGEHTHVGLAHYRRYLALGNEHLEQPINGEPIEVDLSGDYLKQALEANSFIVPRPYNLAPQTVREQYGTQHYVEDIDAVAAIVKEKFPAYAGAVDTTLASTVTYPCNMFVMPRAMFNEYAEFLLGTLEAFRATHDVNAPKYGKPQNRVTGFLAERVTDIFIRRQIELGHQPLEVPMGFWEKGAFTIACQQPSYAKPEGFSQTVTGM